MHSADIVICGAGIIGLTLARELVLRGHSDILILEKEDAPGRHASGRNSGVLHAGIYYDPGTLKAKYCWQGNQRMKAYCRERGLPLGEDGKVIVAREAEELPTLSELFRRAKANGADVEMIDQQQLAEIEPNAKTVARALYSRDTAVVDPRAVVAALREDLAASGKVRFAFDARFTGLRDDRTAATTAGEIGFGLFVNAGGAHADKVARPFGVGREYVLIPFKGIYRKLKAERAHLCRGSIYPVPNIKNPFLGVHFTRSVHGDVYLGPTAIPALGRENYGILAGMDAECLSILAHDAVLFFTNKKFRGVALEEPRKYNFDYFFNDAKRLVKQLSKDDIEPTSKSGIRPQLVHRRTHEMVMDFIIEPAERSVHVLNSISPAFTSSMFFAELLADACEKCLRGG